MACEYGEVLGVIEARRTGLRFRIGRDLVQVDLVTRIEEGVPDAGSRCLLEVLLEKHSDSDRVTIDRKNGLRCQRCGKRISLTMARVRPEGIRQRRRW